MRVAMQERGFDPETKKPVMHVYTCDGKVVKQIANGVNVVLGVNAQRPGRVVRVPVEWISSADSSEASGSETPTA